jgi:hypothetical protein
MEQTKVTREDETRRVASPAWLQRRIRRSLVKASLSRIDKVRAEQASRVLMSLVNRQVVPIVQEQKPRDSTPNTPDTKPVPPADYEERVSPSQCAGIEAKKPVRWYCFWRRGRQS